LSPKWKTRRELFALLAQYRTWESRHDDVTVTALIHGRPVPGALTLVERLRAMQQVRP
jgi:hypothetical protein